MRYSHPTPSNVRSRDPWGPLALIMSALLVGCTSNTPGPASQPNPFMHPDPFSLGEAPFVQEDPMLDGLGTRREEWEGAVRLPDIFFAGTNARAGYYYFQSREDWRATSRASGAQATYPGHTQFIAHDLIGSSDPANPLHQFQRREAEDWNSFDFVTPTASVKIWVFDGRDNADDARWLATSEGLDRSPLVSGTSGNMIDDRGFVARLNGDPATDVQWMEGMPEPGDPAWDWDDWHNVFGRYSFGSSFQDVGIDPDPENAVPHELYEALAYDPDPRDDSVAPDGSPPGDDDPWCIWWEWVSIEVKERRRVWVLKDGSPRPATLETPVEIKVPVLRGDFWLHFPPPWFEYRGAISLGELVTTGLDLIIEQTANADARARLTAARDAFGMAFAEGLEGGDHDALFEYLYAAYGELDAARSAGVTERSLADIEVQALSVVATYAAERAIALDDAGLSVDDPVMRELYGALYQFGEVAREVSLSERSARGAVAALEPVFRTLADTQEVRSP